METLQDTAFLAKMPYVSQPATTQTEKAADSDGLLMMHANPYQYPWI